MFPGAFDVASFWRNILDRVDMSRKVPPGRWIAPPEAMYDPVPMPDKTYSLKACFVEDFVADFHGLHIDESFARRLDPLYHLVLHAGRDAFFDCGTANLDKNRTGVVLAAIALPTDSSSKLTRKILGRTFENRLFNETEHASVSYEESLAARVTSFPASLLAHSLGLGGGAYTLDAACASSLYSVKLACDELQAFRADAMLAGGVSRPEQLYTQVGFSQLRALSPSGKCAAFDRSADGLVVGEGAGIVVLKRLEDAIRDGDRIYAIVRGAGLSNDMSANLLAPDSEGQVRAMRLAYESAGWSPSDVDLIECHGAGTPVGDAAELASLSTLWHGIEDAKPGQCAIGSVKSNVGHLLTGAGAAGLIKTVLAIFHRKIPPSANFEKPSEDSPLNSGPFRVQTEAVEWERRSKTAPRRAAVSAFGFGGINGHLLLEEHIPSSSLPEKHEISLESSEKDVPSIAVVGMAVRFGGIESLEKFQERIFKGESPFRTRPKDRWHGAEEIVKAITGSDLHGAYLDGLEMFPGDFRIPPNEIADILPQQLLMLRVAAQALTDAGMPSRKMRAKTSAVIGISFDYEATNFHARWNMYNEIERYKSKAGLRLDKQRTEEWLESLRDETGLPLTAVRTLGALGGIVASRVAKEFGFGGPCFVVSQEEAAGVRALEIGARSLQRFETDSVLVGAVDLACDARNIAAAHRVAPWSRKKDVFAFDRRADGSLPGEGAVALILKRYEDALKDGDRIYAVVRGMGASSGTVDSSSAVETCLSSLKRAFADAKVSPGSVGHFETLGSGEPSADDTEAAAIHTFFNKRRLHEKCALGATVPNIGNAGSASGLAAVAKTCLCLYQQIIPPLRNFESPAFRSWSRSAFHIPAFAQYWSANRQDGPRRACAGITTRDGGCAHVVLESFDPAENDDSVSSIPPKTLGERKRPAGYKDAGLFCIGANDKSALLRKLAALKKTAEHDFDDDAPFEKHARRWFETEPLDPEAPRAVCLLARSREQLAHAAESAVQAVRGNRKREFNGRNFVAYNPEPFGPSARIAFLFPGSGNHFLGMGREIGVQWPEIYRDLDRKTEELKTQLIPHCFVPWRTSWESGWREDAQRFIASDVLHMIFGQVVHGGVMSNLARSFGVEPSSVIGYSLGESAGLFALGAWPDRGGMLSRMRETDLFSIQLAGPCRSARKAWNIGEGEPFQWSAAVVNQPAENVRKAISNIPRARLLIVNTPDECVIGGQKEAVDETIKKFGCDAFFLDGVVTVHCDAAAPSAEAYRKLHLFPTTPVENVRFYSCANEGPYDLTKDKAAESILKQALYGFDFPKTVQRAYEDGIRLFLEMGPHSSCTRMIKTILKDKPHLAVSASSRGEDEYVAVLKFLGSLVAERVPVKLERLYGREAYAYELDEAKNADERTAIFVPAGGRSPRPALPDFNVESEPEIETVSFAAPETVLPEEPPARNGKEAASFFVESTSIGEREDSVHGLYSEFILSLKQSTDETAKIHRDFLRFSEDATKAYADIFRLQTKLLEALIEAGGSLDNPPATRPSAEGGYLSELDISHLVPSKAVPAFDRDMCMEFAVGSLEKVLGPEFAVVDTYKARVRLPDEPLMLVDRILSVEGEKGSMTSGKVITEHDVLPGAWYLDGDRAPVCISVEAGQADLFLCSYLGIDLKVKGERTYRLLDAKVRFHRGLPRPGDAIRYDIGIEKFVRQGETYLFFFHFEGYIGDEHLITMTDGCAGFFTEEEIRNSGGIVLKRKETEPAPGKVSPAYRPLAGFDGRPESYDDERVDALRRGDLEKCFGARFAGVKLARSLWLPGGRMRLIHRVLQLDPKGGRYGLGIIRAEADIRPDDWFLTCHFMDDMVMPGTLMYECCAHALRVLLQRIGWATDKPGVCYEPLVGIPSILKCRGPVTTKTRRVIYEAYLKEIGYAPEPYVIADALMYGDGHPIVFFQDMSMKMTGATKEDVEKNWLNKDAENIRGLAQRKPVLYDRDRILAFAIGKPSEAFGKPYEVFDRERVIARLPGPPYAFMDRVVKVEPEPWVLKPDGWIEAEYDLPADAWYYKANRTPSVPFCVLLEIALQPCGWLAAYAGSALRSENDLKFRNLGGEAELLAEVFPENGPLVMRSRMTKVSEAGEMIIENFDFEVLQNDRMVYKGNTYFGFFTKQALATQVGIRGAEKTAYSPKEDELRRGLSETFAPEAPLFPEDPAKDPAAPLSMPAKALLMVDGIETYIPDGGPKGLGFIRGVKKVDPSEWFFKAHFYQDPVCPGSLGLESFIQLLKYVAVKRWGNRYGSSRFETITESKHAWTYRGQIIRKNEVVRVEAAITRIQEEPYPAVFADGFLNVDGLWIYKMDNFGIGLKA